jgi:hypothetical protein
MNRKLSVLLVGILLLLATLGYQATRPAPVAPTAAPAPQKSSPSASQKRAAIPRPERPARAPRPIRKSLPPAPPAPEAPAPAEGPPADGAEAASKGPIDRRENPDPDAARQIAEIKEGMDLVSEDIGACISSWEAVYPALNGRVAVAFSLNADGLEEAWIMDSTDIPPGPLDCFSAAVWGVEWEGIVRDPVEVTFPFEVRSDEQNSPSKED